MSRFLAGKQRLACMDLAFDRDFDPRHGEAVFVAPGIRRVTAPNRGPFTFEGTNTFLIGDTELAVLDPGPDDPRHMDALVRAIGSSAVRHILVSHTHRDHSPAARLLRRVTGAPILGAGPHRPARPPFPGELAGLDAAADMDFQPDHRLADGDFMRSGGYELQAIATPGHTANHLAFALLGRNIIFSGDHVMGWATPIVAPPDGSMGDYMASLDRLLARPERLYLPAHGGPIVDGPAFVRGMRTHRRMRERAILDRLAQGDQTVVEIVTRIYGDLDTRLVGAASLTTLAHLEHLVARGLAWSHPQPSLAARYGPAGSGTAMPATGVKPVAFGSG